MNKLDRWILGLIVSLGVLLPWATGAGVKLCLQAQGRPTDFLSPISILFELPLTLWLASPYLAFALVARAAFRDGHMPFVGAMSARQRRTVVLVSLGVGSVATVAMFSVIFWERKNIGYILTPLPVALQAVGIVVGWTCGLAVVFMAAQLSKLLELECGRKRDQILQQIGINKIQGGEIHSPDSLRSCVAAAIGRGSPRALGVKGAGASQNI